MLFIKNTKNLAGITLHGDYKDLNMLYNGLHRYLAFYFQNQEDCDSMLYDSLLGLCYDIRHAFQGDRNTESIENNAENIGMLSSCIFQIDEQQLKKERTKYQSGNLYFNVEILYPWTLFYLFSLQNILDEWYLNKWFSHLDFPYDVLEMQHDRAVIELFLNTCWLHLRDTLSSETVHSLYEYFDENAACLCHPFYVECLCQLYISQAANLPENIKKQYLLAICYKSLITDTMTDFPEKSARCSADYQTAMAAVTDTSSFPLYSYYDFYKLYTGYFNDSKKEITEEMQNAFIETYFGIADWENLEW